MEKVLRAVRSSVQRCQANGARLQAEHGLSSGLGLETALAIFSSCFPRTQFLFFFAPKKNRAVGPPRSKFSLIDEVLVEVSFPSTKSRCEAVLSLPPVFVRLPVSPTLSSCLCGSLKHNICLQFLRKLARLIFRAHLRLLVASVFSKN